MEGYQVASPKTGGLFCLNCMHQAQLNHCSPASLLVVPQSAGTHRIAFLDGLLEDGLNRLRSSATLAWPPLLLDLTSNAGLSPTTFKLLLLLCLGIAGLYLFIISRSHARISVETLTMSVTLKHLKIAPKDAHTATIIFLHVSCLDVTDH